MRLSWSKRATADVAAIRDHIAAEKPRAAAVVLETLRRSAQTLPRFPSLGRPGRADGTRELVVAGTPFVIVYRLRKDCVELLAVLHASRQFPIMEP